MPRQITIFTGSFKPPHKGHLELVKKMLECTEKPREGDKGPGTVYIFISNKPREICDGINGPISKEIWKTYIDTLPKKDQNRVKLVLARMPSPTQTAYGFVKRISSPGDVFFLIKSAKNARDTRYESFKILGTKNVQYKELILPGYESMHSTDMRKALHTKDRKTFNKFLPRGMKLAERTKLWKRLRKLC